MTNSNLPYDLFEAENIAFKSLLNSLQSNQNIRKSFNFKFEGLKLLPLSIRLCKSLQKEEIDSIFIWPDTGATALAKVQPGSENSLILSFKELMNKDDILDKSDLLVAIAPKYFDYEIFESICTRYSGPILTINPKLEEPIVGIGSVARQRRKSFLSSWENTFWLEPLERGALMRSYPNDWQIYKYTSQGYLFESYSTNKPSQEDLFAMLT